MFDRLQNPQARQIAYELLRGVRRAECPWTAMWAIMATDPYHNKTVAARTALRYVQDRWGQSVACPGM